MNPQDLTIIDITQEAITSEAYKNIPVSKVNDPPLIEVYNFVLKCIKLSA